MLKKIFAVLMTVALMAMVLPMAMADDFTGYNCITTKEQLNNIRNSLSAKYYLGNDIVFTEADFAPGGAFYNNGKGWEPIGSSGSNGFKGVFDGNGYTIKGLQINASGGTTYFAGLFGYNLGSISNVNVEDTKINVSGGNYAYAGVICGATSKQNIKNCIASGEINITGIKVQVAAGGIAGGMYSGSIENCLNKAKINVGDSAAISIGGIVGSCSSKIYSCGNTGSLNAKGRSDVFAGGICGSADAVKTSELSVTDVYNVGTIVADSLCDVYAGGLVGRLSGSLNKAFNSGIVSARANTYEFKGRVVGQNKSGTIINSYYLADEAASGDGFTGITATQAANQSTFTDFNFGTTWKMQNGIPVIKSFLQVKQAQEDQEDISKPVNPPQVDENDQNIAGDAEGNGGLGDVDPNASQIPTVSGDDPVNSDPGSIGDNTQEDPFGPSGSVDTNPEKTDKLEWAWVIFAVLIVILITAVIVLAAVKGWFTRSGK